jgi:hypothetical protein
MNKTTFGMSLATFALVIGLAAPSAFAAGGGVNSGGVNAGGVNAGGTSTGGGGSATGGKTSTGGGGGNAGETGGTGTTASTVCMKVSATATEAFSYYTMLTLSDNIQNCSAQTEIVATKWSAGAGASAACAASLATTQSVESAIAPSGRVAQTAISFSPCAPTDPIVATVTNNDGQLIATASAGWVTGVTP